MRRVAVLGSTGSIGRSTLEVIAGHPDRLRLVGIAARSRIDLLAEQARAFRPTLAAVWEEEGAQELRRMTGSLTVGVGPEGLTWLATHPDVDVVVVATSGSEALIPLIRAIQAGKQIALASKELLVMAGELIMRLVQEHGVKLVPIDSEHVALAQCLQAVTRSEVARLVITGSGGPLWGLSVSERQVVTRAQVLAHPRWQMGPKITVDSATLMNKGLEVIEARWLFDVPLERLRVLIHPEAVIHALVELVDGTALAQMSPCDMRLPIQYALSAPERWDSRFPRMDVTQRSGWHFFEPDLAQFPCLRLALDAAAVGGSACVALNGANDAAVQAYLAGQMAFPDIPRVIEEVLEQHPAIPHPTLDEVVEVDGWSRRVAQERISHSPRRFVKVS
ncbi:MAG: 1-deoxy-D-xylulose-5-phosphate reductoisomerase [Candidatus Omnitrophota bacterium]|nr:1-deoxy-D-xylulose-5-phosphate reductoisomerase [Candidatus Omnitrophota bacterium]